MPRVLRNLRIREISSVDKGAGDGVKIVLMKRADTPLHRKLKQMFGDLAKSGKLKPRGSDEDAGAAERREQDLDIDREDQDVVETRPILSTRLQSMVDALVAAEPSRSEQQALHHLLHTPRGRQLAEHLASITKKEDPMTPIEKLHQYVKASGGIVGIAKHIVAQGHTPLTEREFSDLIMEAAKRDKRQGESDHQAFARLFVNDPDVRKAHAIAKSAYNMMRTEPLSVETGSTTVQTDADKAAKQIAVLVEEQRRLSPTLNTSQLYEAVYRDPANRELLQRAHKRPTASSTSGDELQR